MFGLKIIKSREILRKYGQNIRTADLGNFISSKQLHFHKYAKLLLDVVDYVAESGKLKGGT